MVCVKKYNDQSVLTRMREGYVRCSPLVCISGPDTVSQRAGTLEAERKLSEEDFYAASKGTPFAQV